MDEVADLYQGRPTRVSLGDVADATGVSKATVCRALRGRGRISEATREKIRAAAAKLGYAPDPALSALTRYRWGDRVSARPKYKIALVVVNPPSGGTPSAKLSRHITGVLARTTELNLMAEEHVMEAGGSPASLARILHARGTDGIIFYISGPVFAWDFPWHNFACVTLGFDGEAHRLHAVTSDWFSAVRRAASRAEAAGKRRLGFVSFFRGNPSIDGRTHAAMLLEREQLAAKFGPQPPVHLYPADGNLQKDIYQTEQAAFLKWFEKHRPDVVIDGNNLGYWWLRNAGYKMPREVSYISLNSDPEAGANCSGILHLRERQGRMAVDLLFSLIQMNERGMSGHPMRLTCECDWFEGGTLGGTEAARRRASRQRNPSNAPADRRKISQRRSTRTRK